MPVTLKKGGTPGGGGGGGFYCQLTSLANRGKVATYGWRRWLLQMSESSFTSRQI